MTAVGVAARSSASLPRHGRVGADGLDEALEPVGLVTLVLKNVPLLVDMPVLLADAGGPERRSVGVVAVAVLVSRQTVVSLPSSTRWWCSLTSMIVEPR